MALPLLNTLEDCADFSKAVKPYIPQLYALPEKLLDVFAGRESLLKLYTETNPLISGFAISVALGAVFLVVAEINRNYSQVDRCWSLLPTLYIAHFDAWARLTGLPTQRIDAALLFSAIWSVSLARKPDGGDADHATTPRRGSRTTTGEKEATVSGTRTTDGKLYWLPQMKHALTLVIGKSSGSMSQKLCSTSLTGPSSRSSKAFCSS
jgi:hypothetical protein